ncbi:hypothetical protein D3H55_01495 [Bacillus salacetis]|uniref:Uncharacterized protein n=1 Tax=Bacillus salacetis TaxID=2315464 RepID=A0A3A1RDM2_9BACI|nr:hypothetical protein [Bacillus salacetis]RIW39055.1 hypothetical protein D3H55_01495 [Bacillus salacetis]
MKFLENLSKWATWILAFLIIPLLGLFFYTPEYESIKKILNYEIPFSLLFLLIIIMALLLISSQVTLYIIKLRKKISFNDLDRKVLNEIKELVPMTYARDFFERMDFGSGKFPYENIRILHSFIETEGNPEFEFIDNDLEEIRISLLEDYKKLDRILAEYVARIPNANSEDYWRIDKCLKEKDYDLYIKIIRDSNQVGTDIWENYKKLVEIGRKRLGK